MAGEEKKKKEVKEDKSGGSILQLSPKELAEFARLFSGGTQGDQDTTQTNVIRLTPIAARQLLDTIATDVQYTDKFSKDDIDKFVKLYNEAANKQLDTVVRSVRERVKESGVEGDVSRTVTNIVTKEFPQFFNPKTFAEDFIWSKINFDKEATLGARSLEALQRARGILNDYGKYMISDIELQDAAKKLARGQMTDAQFKAQLNQVAALEYPELAETLKANPNYTVRQLRGNKINLMADVLELDPNEIELDNPVLEAIKGMGIADAKRYLRMRPEAESTTAENENARQAATSLARAMGFGV